MAKHWNDDNECTMTVYLGKELRAQIEEMSEISGLTRSKVVSAILRAALPHVKLVERRSYTFAIGRLGQATEHTDEEVE